MKINIVPTIISVAISALLAYALHALCKTEGMELLLAIGGGLCFFVTLTACLGVRFEKGRTSTNTSALAMVFFFLMIISNGIFAFIRFSMPAYIVINGVLLLAFLLTFYAVVKAKAM